MFLGLINTGMGFFFIIKAIFCINATCMMYHPVHVSVTNIEMNISENKIDYSIRIFADDFEYALIHLYEKEISFADGISPDEKNIVVNYINSGFGIIIDGLKCQPECIDIKVQDNSTWLYFQILLPEKETKSIKLINRILLDMFPDQTNLTIFTIDKKQKGFTFDYMNQETEININNLLKPKIEDQ